MQYTHMISLLCALSTQVAALPADFELTGITAVESSPLERRQFDCNNFNIRVVNHNSLKFIPWAVRDGPEGQAMLKYEPYLHIAHGCRSYPAVSQAGEVSGGLQNSGSPSGGCNDGSNGQTYVRGKWYRGRYAIMYSWYFPKDQISAGGANGGHRHDFESVVVWIDNPANANPKFFGAAASGHGKYPRKTANPQMRDGQHLQVEYYTNFPTNHELQFKTSPGNKLAMIDWDKLTDEARCALNRHSFGKANVPFKDANFDRNLDLAWI